MQDKRYSIGEAAESCGIPIKTLRYYDKINFLKPAYRDANSNYRYYSKKQLTTLLIIRRLRAMDFSLNEIRSLMNEKDLSAFNVKIDAHCQALRDTIEDMQIRLSDCENLLSRGYRGHKILNDETAERIQVEEIPAHQMIFQREQMNQYCNSDVSLRRWTDILEVCTSHCIITISPVVVTFYTQPLDQFLMKDCDVEFGQLIDETRPLPKDITNIRIFGGYTAATTYHLGTYDNIVTSHIRVLQWINQNGYEVCGPVSEEFVVSPLDVNNKTQQVTKIIIPIAKVASERKD